MYYIVQEKLFREENYENLILALERLELDYEIYHLDKLDQELNIQSDRKDVFPFGAVRIAKLTKKYDWNPGSFYNENHDYTVYSKYYKDNLLNWDSKIISVRNVLESKQAFFARPTKDTKAFTGRVFNNFYEFYDFIESKIEIPGSILTLDTQIQRASVKQIQKEIRFWIVQGQIVTASQYALGNEYNLSDLIDADAYYFVQDMIKLYQPARAFVMDIALTENGYKIVEINCINSAGFYKADMNRLLIALETAFG